MTSPYDYLSDDVYSVRTEGTRLRITKFTKDLNPVQFYCLEEADGGYRCNCPQSNRGPCKHQDIMDSFSLYPERIDKGWFYCHQTGDWFPPVVSTEPPAAGGGGAEDPSLAPPVTPEVEGGLEPPSLPSGVMVFSEPLKRRI